MKIVKKYFFLTPIVLFFVLSAAFLQRPFWFDEALTLMNFALLPLEKIYTNYAIPNNHIGFTMLLHIWYQIMPQSVPLDVWCRLLAFLFGAGFLLFSWMKFRSFVFRTSLCCFAVSMPFLIYATSVRGYIAALFFSMTTVYCACLFARKRTVKDGVLLFLSSLCCVSVLPSDLFVLAAAVVYAAPLCGKDFYRRRVFYLLCAIPLAAFLMFWGPLFRLLLAASRLGEGWHDRWASLSAGVITFASCIALILLFALLRIVFFRKKINVKDVRLLVFFTVLPLVFCAKVAPFPRVYFPFFGIFMLTASEYAARVLAFIRKKKYFSPVVLKAVFFAAALGATILLNHCAFSLNILSKCNGNIEKDDYFSPWYLQKAHVPHETALLLAKQSFGYCYLSFSSDPWSVMFYSALNGMDMSEFHFDGPQGNVEQLPDGAMVVINKNESVSGLIGRFGGKFEPVSDSAMHRVFRFSL